MLKDTILIHLPELSASLKLRFWLGLRFIHLDVLAQDLESVMVNFMCQLDWVTGCPGICLNIILSVCEGVLDEINI